MRITFEPTKIQRTLVARGLDFEDAVAVFAGPTLEIEDKRQDYGEARIICFGYLNNRPVVVGYTPRGAARHVFSMRKAMPAKKRASRRSLKSDLARVDAHVIKSHEYVELPELTEEMLARAIVKRGGRPISANPRKQVTIRLPADVLARWKSTGPGWQTRMAQRLSKAR
jgi:uncharacterized DUF497 family protein